MTRNQSLIEQVEAVHGEYPQAYNFLCIFGDEVQSALDSCSRTYPTSKQLYTLLDDPEIPSNMFARILGCLVELDVIGIYTVRSGANRYHLREYDSQHLRQIRSVLE